MKVKRIPAFTGIRRKTSALEKQEIQNAVERRGVDADTDSCRFAASAGEHRNRGVLNPRFRQVRDCDIAGPGPAGVRSGDDIAELGHVDLACDGFCRDCVVRVSQRCAPRPTVGNVAVGARGHWRDELVLVPGVGSHRRDVRAASSQSTSRSRQEFFV